MAAIPNLPSEIRLLIWEALLEILLHQPRTIYINMGPLPPEPEPEPEPGNSARAFGCNDEPPIYKCLCATPVPILLHINSQTRALSLRHYELAFGWKYCPPFRPAFLYNRGWSIKGRPEPTVLVPSNQAQIDKDGPKVYVNFEHDIVVWGYLRTENKITPYFPFNEDQFRIETLQNIRNMAVNVDMANTLFRWFNISGVLQERFPKLKNMYISLDNTTSSDDNNNNSNNLGRKVELIDLRSAETGDNTVQTFVKAYKAGVSGRHITTEEDTLEALEIMCNDHMGPDVKKMFLQNGAGPDEALKYVWLKFSD
jgi:2EXR family